MNKQTKIALIIAPFLTIGGYIATDYYVDTQMNKERFLALSLQGQCELKQKRCALRNGQFQLTLSQTTVGLTLITTHAIDHAVISFVDSERKEKLYVLTKLMNSLNWQLDAKQFEGRVIEKLRLLITVRKTRYLAEINVTIN